MATVASLIDTKVRAASTALEAGDNAGALLLMESAQILLAGMPDSERERDSLTWDRNSIAATIRSIRLRMNAAKGLRFSKIKRVRPGIVA